LPLCVGFGVSKPEHAAMLRDAADGVIVGSALVRKLEQIGPRPTDDVIAEMQELTRSVVAALSR
jgi:tryptophan synthase alpha chain